MDLLIYYLFKFPQKTNDLFVPSLMYDVYVSHKIGKNFWGMHPRATANLHAMDYQWRLKAVGKGGVHGIEHNIYVVD